MSMEDSDNRAKFGTLGGVFTPCTLTILGVIMFLRYGQVVGQSGILLAIVIVAASKSITTLTALSLSAIATNTKVKGGGAYYLISRSLGVEFGGAIGVVFYLAQAISVAMYVIGFTEAFVGTFPQYAGHFALIATIVNTLTFICVFIGAGWTIKVQYLILAILAGAIVSFFVGAGGAFDIAVMQANLSPSFVQGENFFTMFALFFPAVTGIMAGANMSGDLANPAKSIPRGTLSAVLVTGLIYLAMALLLGACSPREELITNNLVIKEIAAWPILITAGVFAATLSSALGSMMGAPRILQAFARDDIFSWLKVLGAGSGASQEPRRATCVTFVIAQACVMLGDLNAIAPVITMFFMITYGLLNLATFYEAVTRNPSYRPTFKYCHWSVSLLGAVGCLAVMFLINPLWAGVSIAVILALHGYIRYQGIEGQWADLRSGVVFELARQGLLRLEEEEYHPRNWRPVVLALSGSGWNRPHVAVYGHWLTAQHGLLTLAHVVHGDIDVHAPRRDGYEATLRRFIAKEELRAFPAVVISEFLSGGIEALVQCHGIGGLRPNTVLVGWPREANRAESFGANLKLVAHLGRSIIAARFLQSMSITNDEAEPSDEPATDPWEVPEGTIDVWWRGMQNGNLMLLQAHLLQQNPEWRGHRLRVLRVVENDEAQAEVQRHIEQLCASARISADPVVIVSNNTSAAIHEHSHEAAVVILGFEPPNVGDEWGFYERMETLAGDLPRVLLVNSAGGVELE